MSEERRDPKSIVARDGAVAKRPWHPPELQEVDVMETEFSDIGAYDPGDASTYQTS